MEFHLRRRVVPVGRPPSAAAAIGRDALIGNPDTLWRLPLCREHVDRHAAAREPVAADFEPTRFQQSSGVGLVHCAMEEFDHHTGDVIRCHAEGDEGWLADELLLWERPAVNVSGSSIMVSRESFESVGGFDPMIKVGEDWDFCYRIAKKYKVAFVSVPLLRYRSHGRAAHRNVAEMERGMKMFYDKAFSSGDEHVLSLSNRSLGNFHRTMAGSYFHAGEYLPFIGHAFKSVFRRPGNIIYFLSFPIRRFAHR